MVNVKVSVSASTINNLHSLADGFGLKIYSASASARGRQWQFVSPDESAAQEFQRCLPPYYLVEIEVIESLPS